MAHVDALMEGEAHKFFVMVRNLFMHHWPPVLGVIFIDYMGSARKVALELVGIMDSPDGAPFPRMDKGFLDLGPKLALDGCELVDLTPEMRDLFSTLLEALRVWVKQWFPNNERQMTSDKGLKSVLKMEVEKKCAPQAQHVYSCALYSSDVHEKVKAEAAKTGKSPNNIGLISQITRAEWKKATPEVRAEIIGMQLEQKKQVAAVKSHCYNEIDLSAAQKQQVIESLGVEFDKMFGLYEALTGWAFVIIGAGIDPNSGNLRSCSWEYEATITSGENFFKTFDRNAAIGLVLRGVKVQQEKLEESVASSSSMDVDVVARDVPKVADNDDSNFNLPPVNKPLPDEPPQGKSSLDTVDEPLPDEPLPNGPPQGNSSADEPLPLLLPN
ncbi:hypothetical protein ARMGADRAFT_1032123 [Armillaria gallica]|uniref:Uncharacterized protein n=1 Tax=Armillaria gallica TaxID=47427 RepID=A0A2H3D748_ARMGA|nr:hypothetical protein ARMGADRAFT_1032123 [Armillaria gallica]